MNQSGSGRLKDAALELSQAMDNAAETWRDSKALEFRNQHITPLLKSVEVACMAMDEMAVLVNQMMRDCGPPREDLF